MSTPRLMSGAEFLATHMPPLRSVGNQMRDQRLKVTSMTSRKDMLAEVEKLHLGIVEMLNQLDSVSETADYHQAVKDKHAYLLKAVDEEEGDDAMPCEDPRGHDWYAHADELQTSCRRCPATGTV